MLMRTSKSKSKAAFCRDWHYGRLHLPNQRHLLAQNASKWKQKMFYLFSSPAQKIAFVFRERSSFCVFSSPCTCQGLGDACVSALGQHY